METTVIVPHAANTYSLWHMGGSLNTGIVIASLCWFHWHFAFCHLSLNNRSALQASPFHFSWGLPGVQQYDKSYSGCV